MHIKRSNASLVSSVAITVGLASTVVCAAWAADDLRKVCSDAQYLYSAKRYAEAQDKYNEALKSPSVQANPRVSIVLWSNLGAAYREDHKFPESERSFKRAIEIADAKGLNASPAAVTAMRQYAMLLRKMERNFDAVEMESKAMGGRPSIPVVAMQPGESSSSEPITSRGETQAPARGKPVVGITRPHIDTQTNQTIPELKKAVTEHPDSLQTWVALGAKAQESGDYDAAVQAFKTIEGRWPENAKICHQQLSYAFAKQGNYSDAAEQARKVINDTPKNPDAYLNLASIYSNMGDIAGQVDAMQQFIDNFPSDSRYAVVKGELDHLQTEQARFAKGPPADNVPRAKWRTWSLANMPLKVYVKVPDQEVAWGKDRRGDLGESDVMQLVQRALNSWTAASNGKINFTLVDSYERSNIAVVPVPDAQGLEAEYQAGVTDYPREGTSVRARVRVALAGNDGKVISKRDFLEVTVHELGHSLGMDHSNAIDDVMYPQQHSASILEPSRHDAEVLNLLYKNRSN